MVGVIEARHYHTDLRSRRSCRGSNNTFHPMMSPREMDSSSRKGLDLEKMTSCCLHTPGGNPHLPMTSFPPSCPGSDPDKRKACQRPWREEDGCQAGIRSPSAWRDSGLFHQKARQPREDYHGAKPGPVALSQRSPCLPWRKPSISARPAWEPPLIWLLTPGPSRLMLLDSLVFLLSCPSPQ